VTEVARAALLSPPAVHAHFPTKAELFEAAFEHDATAFLDVLRNAAGRVGMNGLVDVMPTGVTEIATRPLVRRVFQGLEPEMTPRLMELEAVRGVRAALIERLEDGQAAGVIRADMNSAELAAAIETLLLALLLAAVQAGPLMDGSRREALIAVLQHGVLAQPKRRR
jgi:AcrR family transcriptional regulator